MQGVRFGTKHSFFDFGLYLKSRPVVSAPMVKTKYVEVEGADGEIDFTSALTGRAMYENRKITCEFVVVNGRERWADVYSNVLNTLHGKHMRIILDNDPFYYYEGRLSVREMKSGKKTATIIVDANVNPYKTETNRRKNLENITISNGATVTVKNCGSRYTKPVLIVPENGTLSVVHNGTTTGIGTAGTYTIDGLYLHGDTGTITFTGSGKVTVDFHGGWL